VTTLTGTDPWELPSAMPEPRRFRRGRLVLLVLVLALAWKLVVGVALATLFGFDLEPVAVAVAASGTTRLADAAATEVVRNPELDELRESVRTLERTFARQAPGGRYIVIDRGNNRLWVRSAQGVELEAVVSTGSGTVLKESGGKQRTWTFQTPVGRLKVLSMRRNPVWVKPDWAFLEEGKPIPPSWDAPERRQQGVLGDFLLDLGGGVAIHGTPHEHLLGQSVTHGCIRVGRDDLRVLFDSVPVGAKVYIY